MNIYIYINTKGNPKRSKTKIKEVEKKILYRNKDNEQFTRSNRQWELIYYQV